MIAVIDQTAPVLNEQEEPFYPDSDGEPTAESDLHQKTMMYCMDVITAHFHDRREVYVAGNNFLYYQQGQPYAVVSPDCYVVFGAGQQPRKSYKLWLENDLRPSFVIETSSEATQSQDINRKYRLYQDVLRVDEYFLYDPTGDYIGTRLVGYRLTNAEVAADRIYELIQPDAAGRLHSEQLGLDFFIEDDQLRLFDPLRGTLYQTYIEALNRADEQAKRADAATQANAQLRAQLTTDAQAAAALQAELAQMRAALEALQTQTQEAATLQSAGYAPQDEQE